MLMVPVFKRWIVCGKIMLEDQLIHNGMVALGLVSVPPYIGSTSS